MDYEFMKKQNIEGTSFTDKGYRVDTTEELLEKLKRWGWCDSFGRMLRVRLGEVSH